MTLLSTRTLLKGTIILFTSLTLHVAYSQAKKPTIMILPAKEWCVENGFTSSFDNQGVNEVIPDYEKALNTYPDLAGAIGKIDQEMRKDGFPTELLQSTLDQLKQDRAEESVMVSKSGAEVLSSPIDKLRATAKTDFEFHIYWKIEKMGPRKRITQFRLQGIDTYTNQAVAFADGSGEWVSASEISDADLIREAVLSKMDGFKADLQNSFDKMFKDGRQISLNIRVWDNWGFDLESEDFGGEELSVVIEEWISEHSVQGRFGTPKSSATRMDVKGIFIPIYDEKGKPNDAPRWGRELSKYLKSKGVTEIKVDGIGLGRVQLFLGGK